MYIGRFYLYIATANTKQILADVDCIIIAEIHHSAKVWVSYTEYTILGKRIDEFIFSDIRALYLKRDDRIRAGVTYIWKNI